MSAADSNVESSTRSVQQLGDQHREIFIRAVNNILSSPIAEATFGQIIDGLPLSDVVYDIYSGVICPGHPLLDERFELSAEAIQKVRQLRDTFYTTSSALQMDTQLLHAYQIAAPGSRAFKIRLIELVAVTIHTIAVWLFKQEPILKEDNSLVSWRPSGSWVRFYHDGYPKTFFRHKWYRYFDQYPEGIADGVGYWAESRVFGGVVLFDRRSQESIPEAESDAVYLHPDRRRVTYRIFKLLDEQKQALVEFLLSKTTPPSSCPLPFIGDRNNRIRVDPEEPIASTGIYRDLWERKPLGIDEYDIRSKDVLDTFNYLSYDEWEEANYRARMMRIQRYKDYEDQ